GTHEPHHVEAREPVAYRGGRPALGADVLEHRFVQRCHLRECTQLVKRPSSMSSTDTRRPVKRQKPRRGFPQMEDDRLGAGSYGQCVPTWDCGSTNNPTGGTKMASDGRLTYSVYSGRRAVAVRRAWSGAEAVIEYLTTLGCRGNEIVTLGP